MAAQSTPETTIEQVQFTQILDRNTVLVRAAERYPYMKIIIGDGLNAKPIYLRALDRNELQANPALATIDDSRIRATLEQTAGKGTSFAFVRDFKDEAAQSFIRAALGIPAAEILPKKGFVYETVVIAPAGSAISVVLLDENLRPTNTLTMDSGFSLWENPFESSTNGPASFLNGQ